MWKGGDTEVAAPLVRRCLKAFPELEGMQLRPGLPQPVEPKGAGRSLGIECFAEERQEIGGRAGARDGTGLRGGAQADAAAAKLRRLSGASPENRTAAGRQSAEPAPMLRKTEAEAEPAASGAGIGLLPAINVRDRIPELRPALDGMP